MLLIKIAYGPEGYWYEGMEGMEFEVKPYGGDFYIVQDVPRYAKIRKKDCHIVYKLAEGPHD